MKRSIFALAVCLSLAIVVLDAAVAFRAVGLDFSENHATSQASPFDTNNGTVSVVDTNRTLVYAFCANDTAINASAVAADPAGTNQALTKIGGANNDNNTLHAEIWALTAPAAITSAPIRVTYTGATPTIVVYGTYFTGTDQGGTATTVKNFSSSSANSTAPALTIATGNGSATFAIACDTGIATLSAPTPQTQAFLTNATLDVGGGYKLSTTTSDTHNWTYSTNTHWVMVGVEIMQTGGDPSGATAPRLTLMGVGH